MRSIFCIVCSMLVFPCILPAESLQIEVPPGLKEVYLLSPGTSAVLEHLQGQFNDSLDQLSTKYQIDLLKEQEDKAAALAREKEQAYANKFESLKQQYLSSISLSIISSEAEIFPASSALGEVSFFYTIKNNSDRIISDITYRPKIGGITLPTTSALILDLIHPVTLKSGLGPNETLSNKGHEPEHFSFFIGELSREELKKISSEMKKDFTVDIVDMHFSQKKGYKGQTNVVGFKDAFSDQLQLMQISIERARADAQSKKASYNQSFKGFSNDKDAEAARYSETLNDLKKTAIRSRMRVDEKNRCTFENIPAGTYIVYAPNAQGKTVFEHVTISGSRNKLTLNEMIKDPFVP
ncbi:MAG TPA: hypothetical protein PLU81_07660 [Deltaproteobacteria bacterium]|nr:hypothetical protein [Deltaproteobacteria bacterium]